jgi:hypothetical protein
MKSIISLLVLAAAAQAEDNANAFTKDCFVDAPNY